MEDRVGVMGGFGLGCGGYVGDGLIPEWPIAFGVDTRGKWITPYGRQNHIQMPSSGIQEVYVGMMPATLADSLSPTFLSAHLGW